MKIDRDRQIRLIVVPLGIDALDGLYGREKLAPLRSLFTVQDVEEGLSICQRLLTNEGRGHTAIFHTSNQELIERFSAAIAASRILINAPGAHGCIGLSNGLTPSLTLGCGTFGGTSTTDNISYTHLLDIKRVVYRTAAQVV
jgi:acetaldehyde dehydrogenase / alcohol dehydrogenase